MVVILNEDGSIYSATPSTLIQGQNNASTITVIGPQMAAASTLEISFVLPTGEVMQWNIPDSEETTAFIVLEKTADVKIGDYTYPAFNYTVPGCLTNDFGTLQVCFTVGGVNGETQTYAINYTIEESVVSKVYTQESPISSLAYIMNWINAPVLTSPNGDEYNLGVSDLGELTLTLKE